MDRFSIGEPLKTIREVLGFPRVFHIPNYQRGYKWTALNVFKLLDDIRSFDPSSSPMAYYCLQNITLYEKTEDAGGLNVVDGQQRLTTIVIVLSYLKSVLGASTIPDISEKMTYDVRNITQQFLSEKIFSGDLWREDEVSEAVEKIALKESIVRADSDACEILEQCFNKSIEKWNHEKGDYDHSDVFHLYCAAVVVRYFFEPQSAKSAESFLNNFLDRTKLLLNVVRSPVKESEIFSKINGFRVPLDGADLVRAIFVTNVARELVTGGEVEREVRLNEERIRLGLELDQMNAWWGDVRHRSYYSLFDTEVKDPAKAFNVEHYPVNLLYRLYQAAKGKKEILLEQFEHPEDGAVRLYADVRTFHKRLKDWYDDRIYYHYAGFLKCQCNKGFKELYDVLYSVSEEDSSREKIRLQLKKEMFAYLMDAQKRELDETQEQREESFRKFSEKITGNEVNWYAEDRLFKRVMVLLDVIAFTKNTKEGEYHPLAERIDAAFFVCKGEEKEHVFPQTPISSRDLNTGGGGDKLTVQGKIQNYWKLIVSKCHEADSTKDDNTLKNDWKDFWEKAAASNEELKKDLPPIAGDVEKSTFDEWLQRLRMNKWLIDFVQERFNEFVAEKCKIDLNSIGNIVLLNKHTNASYGNDFYSDKRWRIMKDYRNGLSIRLHTRSVFAKEFPLEGENDCADEAFDVWGQRSIERNRAFISSEIRAFFTREGEVLRPEMKEEHENE